MTITIEIGKSTKCKEANSLYVSFPYNVEMISIIRSLPTRYWMSDTKEWEVPYSSLAYLVSQFSSHTIVIKDLDDVLVKEDKNTPETKINYQFKTNPFSHQVEGFNYGMEHDKWLLGDEQGLGKTKQCIDIACAKKESKGYKHCLIICGVNSLKWNWQNEIEIHSNEKGYILGQRVKKNKLVIGSTKDKLDDLNNINNIKEYFIITNVESLRDKGIITKLTQLCKNGTISMIAADECHKMKNSSSQQGKAFLKLNAETLIAMTGTPLMNSPLDLYVILKWLGYETHSFYSYKNYYCEMGGFGGYQVVAYRHLDELQHKLNGVMLRRLKTDVLDLPEKTHIKEYVEMGTEQEKVYKEVLSDLQVNIDKIKMSTNPLAEMIRLRQASGYPGILSSDVQDSAKMDRMEEIVEESISNNRKVIIFSNWTQITDEVYSRLSKNYKCLQITGATKDEERQAIVNAFQNDDSYNVIIGTVGAMGTGLNLFTGSVIIFLDHPWTKATYDQACDRAHRIGQKNNITIYNLICKNTIDEKIWNIVCAKGELSDMLIDNKVKDKGALVDYLLS